MSASRSPAPRLGPITVAELDSLPLCGPGCPVPRPFGIQDWALETQDELGWCGVRVRQGDRITGFVLVNITDSPVRSIAAPQLAAAAVTALWVDPEHRGVGIGGQLIQGLAAMARRSGLQTVVGVGSRVVGTCAAPPAQWWQAKGFQLARQHPVHPVFRLDLERTAQWAWWTDLVDRVRSSIGHWDAPPHPTGRTVRLTGPDPSPALDRCDGGR